MCWTVAGSSGRARRKRGGGEFYEPWLVDLVEGERWCFELRSRNFAPFLTLRSPAGRELFGESTAGQGRSFLEFDVPATGHWQVVVSTMGSGQAGTFQLLAHRLVERQTGVDEPPSRSGQSGDTRRDVITREYFDLAGEAGNHEIGVAKGQYLIASVVSDQFDPVLNAWNNDGHSLFSDDWSTIEVSRVLWQAEADEDWRLAVSDFAGAEQGKYWLEILVADATEVRGEVGPGETDTIAVAINDTSLVIVELISSDFDPMLRTDDGGSENDDWLCSLATARLEFPSDGARSVNLIVEPHWSEDSGSYLLRVFRARATRPLLAPPSTAC